MASQKQQEANRTNAKRSTGPKSVAMRGLVFGKGSESAVRISCLSANSTV